MNGFRLDTAYGRSVEIDRGLRETFARPRLDTPHKEVTSDRVRDGIRLAASVMTEHIPPSAYRTLAQRHLEQAAQFADLAIAQAGA